MPGAVAKPLRLRLFLEGIEVPVVSANVQIGTNAPAVASIQVVPLDQATELRPRTMVHLFFLDQYDVEAPPDAATDLENQDLAHPDLRKNYRLLFCGEVVGFSFVRTPSSRAVILQCLDFSSYWDSCHATAIDWGLTGNAFNNDSFLTASNPSLFDNIINQQPTVVLNWLRSRPETPSLKSMSGLAGGIIRMLEAMGGISGHEKGVNDFFTVAELRCRILAQIAAEENDQTAVNILDGKVFSEWLKNGLENIGLQVTFRDMMKMLFQYIYYDMVPNPAPYYQPAKAPSIFTQKVTSDTIASSPVGKAAITFIRRMKDNVSSQKDERIDSPASKSVVVGTITDIDDVSAKLRGLSAKAASKALEKLRGARDHLSGVVNGGFQASNNPLPKVVDLLEAAAVAAETSTTKVSSTTKTETDATSSRLVTQIIRPDVFFAAPPRCNVIFPEQYSQIAYDRNFLSEVTRSHLIIYSQLLTNGPGNDARLFSDSVVVPSIASGSKIISKYGGPATYRALMDHEVHTGIIPRSEWLPSSAAGAPGGGGDLRGERLGWGKKAALFHFFKYRFGGRTVNLAGRFNPYLVCGFPGLVITRPLKIAGDLEFLKSTDEDLLEKIQASNDIPMQLVGMIGAVSHNVDQGGGTTTVMMHHSRHHGGKDDDFLNIQISEEKSVPRVIRTVLDLSLIRDNKEFRDLLVGVTPQESDETTASAAFFEQKKKEVLFSTKKVSLGVEEESDIRLQMLFRVDRNLHDTGFIRTAKGDIEGVKSGTNIPFPAGRLTKGSKGRFGKIIGVEVLDGTVDSIPEAGNKDAYRKVAIYEERNVTVSVAKPPESIMHPSWISQAYNNENIGSQIYQKFFGVESIVDEVSFTGLSAGDFISNGKGLVVNSNDFSNEKDLDAAIQDFAKDAQVKSIERATNFLSFVYGLVRSEGQDIDSFIRSYNNRPIASLTDVMGSADLELGVLPDGSVQVTAGTLGFHSLAIHPTVVEAKNLAGLLKDPDTQMNRLGGSGAKTQVPPGYDVRWEKRERVVRYLEKLQEGPAFRG